MVVTGLGVLGAASPASAHVSVSPGEAAAGERARVDFRVPTESDTASTVGLEVNFPEEAPIPSVSVGAMPGWSVEVSYRQLDEPLDNGHGGQVTEAVQTITWTADDPEGGIPPGQFGEFPVSLGPLPEVSELPFRSLQTYSDSEVVRWIEVPQEGVEAERPAPVLTLTAGSTQSDTDEASDTAGAGNAAAQDDSAASAEGSDGAMGTWLGGAGLVAGAVALALGGVAFARTRAATASPR